MRAKKELPRRHAFGFSIRSVNFFFVRRADTAFNLGHSISNRGLRS